MKWPPRTSRPLVPRLRTLLLFLLLGAAVNIAVALVVFVVVVNPVVPASLSFGVGTNPDADAMKLWQTHSVDGWPKSPLDGVLTHRAWYDDHSWYYYGFGTIEYDPNAPRSELRETFEGNGSYTVQRVRSGGPMRCLQWESWNGVPNAPPGLFVPHVGNDGLVMGKFPVPQTMLWPGFAINTVFYAGACWLFFAAPFVMRRRRRIKRSLCPACAYPVGASEVCTECGKPLPKPVKAPETATRAR